MLDYWKTVNRLLLEMSVQSIFLCTRWNVLFLNIQILNFGLNSCRTTKYSTVRELWHCFTTVAEPMHAGSTHWSGMCLTHLNFSVNVVCGGIHEVENKELHRLTEMPALQCGKVQKHMNWHLKHTEDEHDVSKFLLPVYCVVTNTEKSKCAFVFSHSLSSSNWWESPWQDTWCPYIDKILATRNIATLCGIYFPSQP